MTQSFLPNQHHHMLQPTIYVFITVQMHCLTNLGLILPQTDSKPLWGDSLLLNHRFQYNFQLLIVSAKRNGLHLAAKVVRQRGVVFLGFQDGPTSPSKAWKMF